jgi:hypothetical protein
MIGTSAHPVRHRPSLLFCLKVREGYWGGFDLSSGLLNSVGFLVDMLNSLGVSAKLQQFKNNNEIDAAIKAFNPTNVILEAFWVVPTKVAQLQALYPRISFALRNHSETPFVAHEGIAVEWVYQYLLQGVEIMCNSPRAMTDIQAIAQMHDERYASLISYAPNYYPINPMPKSWKPAPRPADDTVRIGCFGAIRPLKNHLTQAIAAVRFADTLGKKLEFHINSTRIEGRGDAILKNLIALFAQLPRCTLVKHPWVPHSQFLTLMAQMDFCMQCTFSETFNIVSADAVNCCVPVIGSAEIPWLGKYAIADPNSSTSMLNNLLQAVRQRGHSPISNRVLWQWRDLLKYADNTRDYWRHRFGAG